MQVYKYRRALPKDKNSQKTAPEDFLFRRLSPSEDCPLSEDFLFSEDDLLPKTASFLKTFSF